MTLAFGIKLFFELVAIALIIVGLLYEEKLCEFEAELFPVLKQWAKRGFKKGNGSKYGN